jgi:hypothetical protein
MRIRTLKTLLDGNVKTRKGSVVDVEDFKGRDLIALGYAVRVPAPDEMPGAPIAFQRGERVDPFSAHPTGGRDGSGKPPSSSPAGRAPAKRRSTKRKGAADSSS